MEKPSLDPILEATDRLIQRHEAVEASRKIEALFNDETSLAPMAPMERARLKAQLGKIAIRERDFIKALEYFREAGIHFNLLPARIALCYLLLAGENMKGLASELSAVKRLLPDNPETGLLRGVSELSLFQDDKARDSFLTVSNIIDNPSSKSEALRRLVELSLLTLHIKKGDDAAQSYLDQLMTFNPDHPQQGTLKGLLALREGRLDQAIVHFEQKGIVSSPDNRMAVFGTTYAHLQHKDPFKQNRGNIWITNSLKNIKPRSIVTRYLQLKAAILRERGNGNGNEPILLQLEQAIESGEIHFLHLLLFASVQPKYSKWPKILNNLKQGPIPGFDEVLQKVLADPRSLSASELPLLMREMICEEAPMRILDMKF